MKLAVVRPYIVTYVLQFTIYADVKLAKGVYVLNVTVSGAARDKKCFLPLPTVAECPKCHCRYSLTRGNCLHFRCVMCSTDICGGCGAVYDKVRTKVHRHTTELPSIIVWHICPQSKIMYSKFSPNDTQVSPTMNGNDPEYPTMKHNRKQPVTATRRK